MIDFSEKKKQHRISITNMNWINRLTIKRKKTTPHIYNKYELNQ